jgi:hypothetical protein
VTEIHAPETEQALIGLYRSVGFEQVDSACLFKKSS